MKSNHFNDGRSHHLRAAEPLPAEVAQALGRARHRLGRLGSQFLYFPTVGSTNDVAAWLAEGADCEGAVVIADEQTAGRGRRGRTWFSPLAGGLYVSVVLTPFRARVDRERATMLLPLAAGVALADAVEVVAGLRIDLKWPNDLYLSQRKLGGILAEGVGLDVRGLPVPDARERSAGGPGERGSGPASESDRASGSARGNEGPQRRSVLDTRERDRANASVSGHEAPLRRSVLETRERDRANASATGHEAPVRRSVLDRREGDRANASLSGHEAPVRRSVLDRREGDRANASATGHEAPLRCSVQDTRGGDRANASATGHEAPLRRSVLDTRERDRASASATGHEAPLRRSVLDTRERDRASASASGGGAPREVMNVVIGYGINVCPAAFPPELGDRATSLESELGRPIDRVQLLVETLAALSCRYDDLLDGRYDVILDGWRARAPSSIGARVTWTTMAGTESGVTAGIDEDGALLVRAGDRVERIVAGEVMWL